MKYKLVCKYSHAKKQINGKTRSIRYYYLNNVLIFQQKVPFDENMRYGYGGKWHYENEYLLDGKLFQTRYNNVYHSVTAIYEKMCRDVYYPVSKRKLEEVGFPNGLKLELSKYDKNEVKRDMLIDDILK